MPKSVEQFNQIVAAVNDSFDNGTPLPFWAEACYMPRIRYVESNVEDFTKFYFHTLDATLQIRLLPIHMCQLMYRMSLGYKNNMEGWKFSFKHDGVIFQVREYEADVAEVRADGLVSATFSVRMEYMEMVETK